MDTIMLWLYRLNCELFSTLKRTIATFLVVMIVCFATVSKIQFPGMFTEVENLVFSSDFWEMAPALWVLVLIFVGGALLFRSDMKKWQG